MDAIQISAEFETHIVNSLRTKHTSGYIQNPLEKIYSIPMKFRALDEREERKKNRRLIVSHI